MKVIKFIILFLVVSGLLFSCTSKKESELNKKIAELTELNTNYQDTISKQKYRIVGLENTNSNLEWEIRQLEAELKKIQKEQENKKSEKLKEYEKEYLEKSKRTCEMMSSNDYYNSYFWEPIIDSKDYDLIEEFLRYYKLSDLDEPYDPYDIYPSDFKTYQNITPLSYAVYSNKDVKLVKFIIEKSPMLVKVIQNNQRGGAQDYNTLSTTNTKEMNEILINAGVPTRLFFYMDGWYKENCQKYVTVEDFENSNGISCKVGEHFDCKSKIFVYDKKENKYIWLYQIKEGDYYILDKDVEFDPDL